MNFRISILIAGLMAPLLSLAQMKTGEAVVISERVYGDLYVAGGEVTINAPVDGDLIVAGGSVYVNDSVRQDILVGAGTIALNGVCGDDVRSAGGTITLSGQVLGDLVTAGGTIRVERNGRVEGNMVSAGGRITVDGVVNGSLRNASGELVLNGQVAKEVTTRGGKLVVNGPVGGSAVLAANSIELGPAAVFSGDVRYWNEREGLDFGNALKGGRATFDSSLELDEGRWHYLGFASFLMVLWYLGTALVMIVLIEYLFSRTFSSAANSVKNATLKSVGLGFLFLVGTPIAVVLLLVTVIGIPVGILLLAGYVVLLVLATIMVALIAANWINNTYYESAWGMGKIIIAAFVIFIFLKLATLTPVVGPLIMLLLVAMAFGGILLNIRWKRNKALALT